MATTTLSVSNGNRGKIYTLTYSVSSTSTATTVTLTSLKVGNSSWAGSPIIIRFYADSTSTQITSITDDGWAVDSTHTINKTYSWNKDESAQTKHVLVYGKQSVNGSESTIGTTDIEVSVPALAKYAVTYNANGGSGAPATQYKVYGKNLTLSTVKPTRSGFSFVKWFTKADGTGTGYLPGATYSANAALSLYAKWSAIPSVTSLKVIRSNSAGSQDDSGTYAKVTATWTMESSTSESATVTGTITPQGGTSSAITLSGTTTGTGGTVTALVPNMDTDTQYVVAITAANGSNTATRSAVLTRAFFIMDFKAGGGGIGIGRAAPSDSLAVGYNAEFDGNVNIFGPTNISSTLDTTGKITSLGNVQAQCYLILRANEDNYSAIRTIPGANNASGRSADAIKFYGTQGNADGDEIVIGNGGQVIVGSGESATSLHTALNVSPGTEQTYITSDNSIFLCTKANTIGNRVKWQFQANNYPSVYADCGAENGVVIGTSTNNGVTANTSIGNYIMRDKNGYWTLNLGCRTNASDNSIYGYLGVRNKKEDGTDVMNYIQAIVDKAGNRKYNVSDAGAFRSAIAAANAPTQLYYNATGVTGTVTLSDTAANYNYLRIFIRATNDNNQCSSVVVYAPNNKHASLEATYPATNGTWIKSRLVKISAKSITNVMVGNGQAGQGGSSFYNSDNTLYIYRVEGWK